MPDKIVYYDDAFMKKFEELGSFLDIEEKDHPKMHRFLIDSFDPLTSLSTGQRILKVSRKRSKRS